MGRGGDGAGLGFGRFSLPAGLLEKNVSNFASFGGVNVKHLGVVSSVLSNEVLPSKFAKRSCLEPSSYLFSIHCMMTFCARLLLPFI